MGKSGNFSSKLIDVPATLFGTLECKNAFNSVERNY